MLSKLKDSQLFSAINNYKTPLLFVVLNAFDLVISFLELLVSIKFIIKNNLNVLRQE